MTQNNILLSLIISIIIYYYLYLQTLSSLLFIFYVKTWFKIRIPPPIFLIQFSITRFQFSFLLSIDHAISVWKVSRMILDVDYKRVRLRWKMCRATFTTGGGTFHLNCRAKSRKRFRSWKGFVGTSKALVQQGDVISFFKSFSNDFVTFHVFPWDRIVLDYQPFYSFDLWK